jgi:hypothetical protein
VGLLDSILGADNGAAIGSIAKQLGIPDQVAQQAASSLVPALSRGLQRNASSPGGLDSLLGALKTGGHEKYVDNPETIGQESSIADGNAILGHIFGSKDVSRNVAGNAAQKTGIDADTLKKMLPMLGTVAMGALAKQTGAGQVQGITGGAGLGGLGGVGGLVGGLSDFLDQDKDGDPTDDILNLAKKYF